MTKSRGTTVQQVSSKGESKPRLNIGKIGIVTRDYGIRFSNGYRDFSHALPQLIKRLDDEGCDTVLFSLFSIIPRKGYDCLNILKDLKNIKAVLLEEFQDGKNREAGRYVVYHRTTSGWGEYEFYQVFGTITGMPQHKLQDFVQNEIPRRTLGNCCVLLCGETNGVKYSKDDKKIHDTFGLRKAISQSVNVVLNPIHDRMTRFEMKLKRQFLSKNNRWVISVWNKGKQDKNGKTKDGKGTAWTVFHNGNELENIPRIENNLGVEIGVLNVKRA
jgi:hypothetical protein